MSDSKSRVFARRARFVAAALAATGCGVAGCQPCLSVEPGPDTGTSETGVTGDGALDTLDGGDTGPSVCLSAPPPDARDDASDTNDSTPDSDGATG